MAALGNPEMLTRKIKLWDINAHITCRLCEGYLIDATTVTECLHTFCRSCLVKYLEENNTCPTCRIVIHQSHPLQYIGHDRTMQDIVYKLVPGLQEAELKKQRDFYQKLGMEVPGDIKGELCNMKAHLDSQRNGEVKSEDAAKEGDEKPEEDNDYHRSDEQVSICLECNSSKLRGLKRKWIRCSAQATVLHLKKFIAKKLNLTSFNEGWSGSRPYPGNTGREVGTHPEWNTSPTQDTIHTHIHSYACFGRWQEMGEPEEIHVDTERTWTSHRQ
ncbi:polycomb group RING finger protein 3 isoform X1 [Ictalurus punctatus]|uniref:Polycomb group RING finger protein 3 isoform X1 n=1 Tax=Ictalurus punctatus TaxID=7998 RepID=A0A9F7RQZ7_ICTPU|nr:polycomb group RING finger protein 3 isoform X1 [Ictalurus punctatus]